MYGRAHRKTVCLTQKQGRDTHSRERVWASSLMRRSAVSQKLGRDTHLERSVGFLSEEERSKEVM